MTKIPLMRTLPTLRTLFTKDKKSSENNGLQTIWAATH